MSAFEKRIADRSDCDDPEKIQLEKFVENAFKAGMTCAAAHQAIRFTLLGEPASKANSRKLVHFRTRPAVIKSDKARNYEADALKQIPPAAKRMLKGDLAVTINVFYASRRPDLDESVILDVMQSKVKAGVIERRGVYLNDRQVKVKHIYWHLDQKNPRAEILVEPICSLL